MVKKRNMLFYLAYGSNLHPVRLTERVPSAELIGPVSLGGYRLMWHKRGSDDSGKCNLHHTGSPADLAHGAIFRIAARHKEALDRFEGKGNGYHDAPIQVELRDQTYNCFTYIAEATHRDDELRPYSWYKQLVMLGGHYHGLPRAYLVDIEAVVDIPDPDHERHTKHSCLVDRLIKVNNELDQQ
jgi:hypothetical protein